MFYQSPALSQREFLECDLVSKSGFDSSFIFPPRKLGKFPSQFVPESQRLH